MTDVSLWLPALEIGCFFSLLGLSYYLVLVGVGFFNLAIGAYAGVGAVMVSWLVVVQEWSLWPAVALSVATAGLLAVATELLVVKPVQRGSNGSELPALIAVVAVLFALQQLAGLIFGYAALPGQVLISGAGIQVGSATVSTSATLLLAMTLLCFVGLAGWTRLAPTGRALRAVGDNRTAAGMLGIQVSKVRLTAFLISGLVAGVAGILFAHKGGVSSTSGLEWALNGFLAFVIGGVATVWAPLVGGLLLGALHVFIPYYFGGEVLNYALFGIAVVFFVFRPEGLFVRRVRL